MAKGTVKYTVKKGELLYLVFREGKGKGINVKENQVVRIKETPYLATVSDNGAKGKLVPLNKEKSPVYFPLAYPNYGQSLGAFSLNTLGDLPVAVSVPYSETGKETSYEYNKKVKFKPYGNCWTAKDFEKYIAGKKFGRVYIASLNHQEFPMTFI